MSKLNIFLDEQELAATTTGELSGLKIAIKDNISVKDWPLTAGSKILEGYVAPYDATVVAKLKAHG
ncbi:MAG: amidase family protein, partial [Bacteroidota bacterium]